MPFKSGKQRRFMYAQGICKGKGSKGTSESSKSSKGSSSKKGTRKKK